MIDKAEVPYPDNVVVLTVLSALNLAIQADWHAESDCAGPALAMTTAPVRLLPVRPPDTFPRLVG